MKILRSVIVCLVVLFGLNSIATAAPLSQASTIHYVISTPTGSADCSSWENACGLQAALTKATTGGQIWVAAGTYYPSSTSDRTGTFQLISGVAIYGGFPAEGGTWDKRNPVAHLTTLSGDIGLSGDDFDNSFHVVTSSGVGEYTWLDGFTITGGKADGFFPNDMGGGMVNFSGSRPTLTNLTFSGNSAGSDGGGMANYNSSPELINVTFSSNSAIINGGGVYNCGGGMFNANSNPSLTNVTFSGNSADDGGGMANYYSSNPSLINVIVWGNTPNQISGPATVDYSNIQDWTSGGRGNISTNPLLGSLADNGGFTQTHGLGAGSPAIGAAATGACPATDQRGHPRLIGGDGVASHFCDMGAYEFGFTLTADIEGSGTVAINPDKPDYMAGEKATLTANPAPDWAFTSWSGDTTLNENPLVVTVDGDKAITAEFNRVIFRMYLPSVLK